MRVETLYPGLLSVSQTLISHRESAVYNGRHNACIELIKNSLSHPRVFREIELSENQFVAGYMLFIMPSKPTPVMFCPLTRK